MTTRREVHDILNDDDLITRARELRDSRQKLAATGLSYQQVDQLLAERDTRAREAKERELRAELLAETRARATARQHTPDTDHTTRNEHLARARETIRKARQARQKHRAQET